MALLNISYIVSKVYVEEILSEVGINDRAKSVIRNLARAEGNVDVARFWYSVDAYLKLMESPTEDFIQEIIHEDFF